MIKYEAASARCRLHIVKLGVMSQFNRKSSDIWTNMSTGMEQVARHNPNSQQKPLGEVGRAQTWHARGSRIESGHSKVLVEGIRLLHILEIFPSDLQYCNRWYPIKLLSKASIM